MLSRPTGASPARALAASSAATVVGVLPLYLTGALAVQLRDELHFGATGLGLAVGIFRITGAMAAMPMGRLADAIGAIWSLRIALAVAAITGGGIATTTTSWATLVGWLMFGSLANSLGQPAANRLLVNRVSLRRQGVAFGLKQSAPPLASMIAGLSVPVVALTVGWRWAYGAMVAWALLVVIAVGRRPPARRRTETTEDDDVRPRRRTLLLLAASFGVGSAASSVIPAFFVTAAVDGGMTGTAAGALLAMASAAAILVRILGGAVADKMSHGHLNLCASLLALGCLGFLFLSLGSEWATIAGVLIAMSGSWGFNGVFTFAVVRMYPSAPGAVTGAILLGALAGAALGPVVFGLATDTYSYTAAWAIAGVMSGVAAAMMIASNRLLDG